MNTLILIEHDNNSPCPSTPSLISAAKAFGPAPVALVIGYDCEAVAQNVAAYEGVESVIWFDNVSFRHHLAEPLVQAILTVSDSFDRIIAPASTFGKNTLPRLAALLDAAMVSDVVAVLDENTFEHPVYAGNAIETIRVIENQCLLTVRTMAFEAATTGNNVCPIHRSASQASWNKTAFVKLDETISERPELTNAARIVSGGRGMQDADRFKLVEQLADVLGAAVGASRAAVDAGFVPNDYQVGQTGKIVAPNLYIAIGISGAIQHLAGMKDSKVIVAINKDADAPIFQVADYGLVGDLFEIVPELIKQLQ